MKIDEILKDKGSEIFDISPSETLADAAAMMRQRNVGALLVRGDDKEFKGIITERDIVFALGGGAGDYQSSKVADVMVSSERLIVAEPDDPCEHVMAVMIQKGIRHMPVISAGQIAGVISIRDLVRASIMKVSPQAHFLSDFLK
jgi:CBS domain-containing protein